MTLLVVAQPMVFTLPRRHCRVTARHWTYQTLDPEITATDYRVELPSNVVLNGNNCKVMPASFTYPWTWYNMIMDRVHTTSFMFLLDHKHIHNGDKDSKRPGMVCRKHPDCPDWAEQQWQRRTACLHVQPLPPSDHVIVAFRPSLKQCMGQFVLMPTLSLLLGWPDEVTIFTGQGNTCIRAPSSSRHKLWTTCTSTANWLWTSTWWPMPRTACCMHHPQSADRPSSVLGITLAGLVPDVLDTGEAHPAPSTRKVTA